MKSHSTNCPSAAFMYCLNEGCPRSASCLRQLAAREVSAEVQALKVLNPAAIPADAAQCPFFKAPATLRLAWGFRGLLDGLPAAEARQLTDRLKKHWSRTAYYRLRCGEQALTPADQQLVADALREVGIADAPVFDRYSEVTDWE